MAYRIASFNMKNLSYGSGRDLDWIARIIKDNDLDIVAMQEVLSEGKILSGVGSSTPGIEEKAYEHSLKNRLGDHWDMCWGNPETGSKYYGYLGNDARGEGYAFLWNTNKFELPCGFDNNPIKPRIWRNYHTIKGDTPNSKLRLIRDPFFGRFVAKGTRNELRLITTHIVYKKPKKENLRVEFDSGAIAMRRNEFNILAGQVYSRIQDYRKDVHCYVPYTIILGDYNLNLASSGVGQAILPDIACFDSYGKPLPITTEDSAATTIYTEQSKLTTLNQQGDGLANNYDHFSYDTRTKSNIVRKVDVLENALDKSMSISNSKYEDYKARVSDHLPIVLEISFN